MKTHIRELDGLRGVAVMLVIAFHAFERAVYFTDHPVLMFITRLTAPGLFGVDVFFTLSGFLITLILMRTRGDAGYFRNFYVRRVLRIVPLYLLGVTCIVVFFGPWFDENFNADIFHALPFMFFYLQNWLMIFGDLPMKEYLGVTWSLAVEEQFYLFWPFMIYFFDREKVLRISLWAIGLSILSRVIAPVFWENTFLLSQFFYFNSFTRFEEILVGAVLAIWLSDEARRDSIGKYAPLAFVLLLLVVLWFYVAPIIGIHMPGLLPAIIRYPLITGLTAAMIAIFVTQPEQMFLNRIFRSRILVFFGKYSYSMYLFHMTIAVVLKEVFWDHQFLGWKAYASYIILVYLLTIMLALLTWHLLEKHMLGLKKYFEYSSVQG